MVKFEERKISDNDFFNKPSPILAADLVGQFLCRKIGGKILKLKILETEAYLGTFDTASHARCGKTSRNSVMWEEAGTIYVYLCYGLHNLFNIVCSKVGDPQAVLIRSVEQAEGPGKLTRLLEIDRSLSGKKIFGNDQIWIELSDKPVKIDALPRVGIGYASKQDQAAPLRFVLKK